MVASCGETVANKKARISFLTNPGFCLSCCGLLFQFAGHRTDSGPIDAIRHTALFERKPDK